MKTKNHNQSLSPLVFLKALPPFAILAALMGIIFYPTILWMVDRWSASDSYYGHGFIIPLISGYWIWKRRRELGQIKPKPDYAGGMTVLLIFGLLQVLSSVLRIYFISAFSMVGILSGLILLLGGRAIFRKLWFPIFFLTLMIPLPLLMISEITLKMKLFASQLATWMVNQTGIRAVQEGSYIRTPNSVLLVADPCSGLRSMLVFMVFGLVFAYEASVNFIKRSVIFASSIPIAILSNGIRIWFLALVSEIYGMQYTGPGAWPHDVSGYFVFIIGFLGLAGCRWGLEKKHV